MDGATTVEAIPNKGRRSILPMLLGTAPAAEINDVIINKHTHSSPCLYVQLSQHKQMQHTIQQNNPECVQLTSEVLQAYYVCWLIKGGMLGLHQEPTFAAASMAEAML